MCVCVCVCVRAHVCLYMQTVYIGTFLYVEFLYSQKNRISRRFTYFSLICQHIKSAITVNGANGTPTQKLAQTVALFCWLPVKRYYEGSVAFCGIAFIRSLKKISIFMEESLLRNTQGHNDEIMKMKLIRFCFGS
jgi:hypothetical protein